MAIRIQRPIIAEGERLNTLTHAIGAGLSVAALVCMVVYASAWGDAYKIVSVSVYGATLIALYLASTLYHSAKDPRVKGMMKLVDHSCIHAVRSRQHSRRMGLVHVRCHLGPGLARRDLQARLHPQSRQTRRRDLRRHGLARRHCRRTDGPRISRARSDLTSSRAASRTQSARSFTSGAASPTITPSGTCS
jgi:hypothetical protein